jgi:hypothetical protein
MEYRLLPSCVVKHGWEDPELHEHHTGGKIIVVPQQAMLECQRVAMLFFLGNTSGQTIFCRTNLTIFCGLGGWTIVKPQYTKFTSCFQGWTLPISIFALWCYALVGQDYTVVTCWEILKNWGWFLGIYTTKYQQPLKDRNGGKTRSKDKSHYMSCIYIMYKYIYVYIFTCVYILWVWYGIDSSPPIFQVAARPKGPKIQRATAFNMSSWVSKECDIRSNWHSTCSTGDVWLY